MDAKFLSMSAVLLMIVLMISIGGPVSAYSVDTHRYLARTAARTSVALNRNSGTLYADIALKREAIFPGHTEQFLSVIDLVGFGAVREDEIPVLRMRNHFFDPQHGGRPLTIGTELGFPSPDWILEDRGALPDKFPKMLPQDYSILKAHRYFLQALSAQDRVSRNRNFGLMFQTLGHVVHHIQDMAQFEHVRNDQHIDFIDTSYYEVWTKAQGRALPVGGYPAIDLRSFATARSFWSNRGKGMAEFTAHNFVSKDTNFIGASGSFRSDPEYPLPAISPDPTIEKVSLASLLGSFWQFFPEAQVWFLGSTVSDVNQPARSRFNPRASTYSILTQDLAMKSPAMDFFHASTTLNRFNFAAAHEFLLPRAVAYSAGLIDYFFRGRLALDSFEVAGGNATLKVRNVSAADFALRERTDAEAAEFSLYYDGSDGLRHRLSLAGADLSGQALPVGGTRTLSFVWPADLATGVEKPFMLVFDGTIGEEAGVAALALEPSGLAGFLVKPNYLPQDGVAGTRLISHGTNGWQLSANAGLLAGNVDWRGDEPGEVLTWDGPPSRYFYPEAKRAGYSNAIYFRGRRLASAPGNVQGASIRNADGGKQLTVVTYQAGQLRLYVRPLRAEYANHNLYDAANNPDGWRLLYAATELPPYTPVFFNASATEAQLITSNGSLLAERVRLRLSANGVTREAVSAVGAGRLESRHRKTVVPSERTLNAGRADPVPGGAQSCTYTNVCTDLRSCPGVGDVCLLSEMDFASENVATVRDRDAFVFDRPTTLCVDYRGDEEVLCQIAYRNDASRTLNVDETDRFESRAEYTNTCPLAPSQMRVGQKESYVDSSTAILGNSMRVLRIGAVEVPLLGLLREWAMESEYLRTYSDADSAPLPAQSVYSGRKTQVESDWSVQSRLLYVDARNGVAVYETDETRKSAVSAWDPTATNSWSPTGPSISHETVNRELIAIVGGNRQSLWRNTSSQDVQYPLGAIGGIGSYGVGRPDCTPVDIDEHQEQDYPFTDTADWSARLHPRANDALQGYGVDRNGHTAASQTIWVRQPDGSYTANGVWNFLSQGEWGSVMPAMPANASFYPIGVID